MSAMQNFLAMQGLLRNSTRLQLFERVFLFAGSFDPPAMHHHAIIENLIGLRDAMQNEQPEIPVRVIVWPVGAYSTKQQIASSEDRKRLIRRAFKGLDVELEMSDLNRDKGFTSTHQMQTILSFAPRTDLHADLFVPLGMPGVLREVWHVIGADNVENIMDWNEGHELWDKGRFLILTRKGYQPGKLPKRHQLLEVDIPGSATNIRELIAKGESWEDLVPPGAVAYIKERGLYGCNAPATSN